VRGRHAAQASRAKNVASKSACVAHRGAGANQVLKELLDEAHVVLDDQQTFRVPADGNQETVLELASAKHAYSLVGRIPFKVGKMQGPGMEILVEGDPHLQRPYMVAVADGRRSKGAHVAAARQLAAWMRSPSTQAWLATYTSPTFGGHPPFYPVVVPDDGAAR
jgi:ABC-type tungstate transport system permease subunit